MSESPTICIRIKNPAATSTALLQEFFTVIQFFLSRHADEGEELSKSLKLWEPSPYWMAKGIEIYFESPETSLSDSDEMKPDYRCPKCDIRISPSGGKCPKCGTPWVTAKQEYYKDLEFPENPIKIRTSLPPTAWRSTKTDALAELTVLIGRLQEIERKFRA